MWMYECTGIDKKETIGEAYNHMKGCRKIKNKYKFSVELLWSNLASGPESSGSDQESIANDSC